MMGINYWAILVCAVLAMGIGTIWYGPLFGKLWMRLSGMADMNAEECKRQQKKAVPLYFVQFALTLLQLFILAHLTGDTVKSGMLSSLIVWAGFVLPTVAASCMWTAEPRSMAWKRFFVQAGFQIACFVVFGIVLGLWI